MSQRRLAVRLFVVAIIVLFASSAARAVIMDFNSLPPGPLLPPNAPYIEDGYTLISTAQTLIVDPTNNGSRMIEPLAGGSTFTITESTSANFGIFTVDIAGGQPGQQISFLGNKFGGGTVTSNFNLTGNPVPSIHFLNWMPNNGVTLTSMVVTFPTGVTAATDTYEFSTIVPEPAAAVCVSTLLSVVVLRRRAR